MTTSTAVHAILQPFFAGLDREHFVVVPLDQKNRPIGINTVSVGSVSATIVHPREVFKVAFLLNATAIILAHNHPSGDPMPSGEDFAITTRLVEAGAILGVRILDHLVLGDDGAYYSFLDQGRLK